MEGDFTKKACCGATFGHSTMCDVGQAVANSQSDMTFELDRLRKTIDRQTARIKDLEQELDAAAVVVDVRTKQMSEDGYMINRLLKETIRQADAIKILEAGLRFYRDLVWFEEQLNSIATVYSITATTDIRAKAIKSLAQAKSAMEGK
jgi:menaquinone-dependent protoporphyrinogen IX oxidase